MGRGDQLTARRAWHASRGSPPQGCSALHSTQDVGHRRVSQGVVGTLADMLPLFLDIIRKRARCNPDSLVSSQQNGVR
jgi:hypothetical protein